MIVLKLENMHVTDTNMTEEDDEDGDMPEQEQKPSHAGFRSFRGSRSLGNLTQSLVAKGRGYRSSN